MAKVIAALVAGLLFGLGLTVSQMVNPAKVLGFLDVAGDWDPSLAFVLAGAAVTALAGFRLAGRRTKPLLDEKFRLPVATRIDGRLLGGAVVFGVGWGLVGLCPGPAVAALSLDGWAVIMFVTAMLVGMALYRWIAPAARAAPLSRNSSG